MHLRYKILDRIKGDLEPVVSAGANGKVSLMRSRAVEQEGTPHFTVIWTNETSSPDGIIPDLETGEDLARIFRRLIVNVIIHFKGASRSARNSTNWPCWSRRPCRHLTSAGSLSISCRQLPKCSSTRKPRRASAPVGSCSRFHTAHSRASRIGPPDNPTLTTGELSHGVRS